MKPILKIIAWVCFIGSISTSTFYLIPAISFSSLITIPLLIFAFIIFYSDKINKTSNIIANIIPWIFLTLSIFPFYIAFGPPCETDGCGGLAFLYVIIAAPLIIIAFILFIILIKSLPNQFNKIGLILTFIPTLIITVLFLFSLFYKYQNYTGDKRMDTERIQLRDTIIAAVEGYKQKYSEYPTDLNQVKGNFDPSSPWINQSLTKDSYEICAWLQSSQKDNCVSNSK